MFLLNEGNGRFSILGGLVYFYLAIPPLGGEDSGAFVDFNFYTVGLRSDVAFMPLHPPPT